MPVCRNKVRADNVTMEKDPGKGLKMFYYMAYSKKPETGKRRCWPVTIMIVFLLFLFEGLAGPAAAGQQPGPLAQSAESAEQAEPAGSGGHLIALISQRMETAAGQLSGAGKQLLAVPGLIKDLLVKAQDPGNIFRWGESMLKILAALAAGLLAGRVVRRILGRPRLALEDRLDDRIWIRALFLFSRTLLDIIPIAGAAIAAYAVLPFTAPAPETRIIALSIVSAAVAVAVILAVARMFFTPETASLQFLFKDEQTGHYLYIWIRRFAIMGIFGHFILEASLLMGIPELLHSFLVKLLGLVIMMLLVTLILQNKKEVAGWLRIKGQKPENKEGQKFGFLVAGTFLRRLADGWHIIAIMLATGFYATWALEIAGGGKFLLWGLAKTLVVIFLTGVLLRIVKHGVQALFHISNDLKKAYPDLEERANRYQPFVFSVLLAIVYAAAFFTILEAWGLGTFGWLFSPGGWSFISELATIFLIIAAAVLLWEAACIRIERSLARAAAIEYGSTRILTLLPLLKNIVRVSLIMIALMLVLSRLGINIGPLLAGAGVVGLAVGFGAQSLVRDMISGAFILIEDSISVGDWVEAAGRSGTVERLTIRTLTLRDLAGTVHVIPFGEVTTVTNYNRDYGYALIDAGVAYRERYGDVVRALQDVAAGLRDDEIWGPHIIGDLEVFGMNKLGDSAVEIRVRLKTSPMKQFSVRRAFLERMKHLFDERDIEIPFPHHTLWFGTGKDGSAPPMRLAVDSEKHVDSALVQGDKRHPRVKIASELEASRDVVEEAETSEQKDDKD